MIISAKNLYYRSKLVNSANDPKASWNVINEVMGHSKKNASIDNLIIEGNSCNDEKTIADYSNEFFTNIGSNLGRNFSEDDAFLSYLNTRVVSTFTFDAITLDQLEKVIMSFKNSSPGYDNLCMNVYKENFDVMGKTLLLICNQSLMQGKFPSELKIAKITPVFKSGDRSEIANYRPISVLSSLSKIIEKVVVVQFSEYLQQNNILNPRQFGFRPTMSTENALHIF